MVVTISLPTNMAKFISPRSHPFFKTSPEVVTDPTFQEKLKQNMEEWLRVKDHGVGRNWLNLGSEVLLTSEAKKLRRREDAT